MGIGQETLIDHIYEAAIVPEHWPNVLERISDDCSAFAAVLFSNTEKDQRWISSPAARDSVEKFFTEGWVDRNSRAANAFRKGFAAVPCFRTEAELYDGDEYERDPIYLEYFRPNGMGWSASTAVVVPHGDLIILSVERAYKDGPVPAAAVAHLDAVRPYLARSAMLAARLSFERSKTAVETLSALGLAACAVDRAGVVLVTNSQFDAERALWTTRGGNRIVLHHRNADARLYEALRVIDHPTGVHSLPVMAEDKSSPAVLHIVPVRREAHDIFARASAILVLTKPSREPTKAVPLLQALFDLSPAEAALAARIAAGQTVGGIAAADGRNSGTLRNQLKSVMHKIGCARQADLSRILAQLIPPAI
ncbi:MAG: helix-turn-helix transcriptional regulator [Rhizobiaceae bacterium]